MELSNADSGSRPLVIYVDPSQTMLFLRTLVLESEGFDVIGTIWTSNARELIDSQSPALVLVDVFERKDELTKFLLEIKSAHRDLAIAVLSQDKSLESRALADCVISPQASMGAFIASLQALLEKNQN